MTRMLVSCLALCVTLAVSTAAFAEGDAERGEKVFKKCKACHLVDQEKNRVGPHLIGVFGRTSGTVEGFKYSSAMKDAAIVWNEETLDAYLEKPRAYLKGTKMAFAGLKKAQDRADVIAYLLEATAPK